MLRQKAKCLHNTLTVLIGSLKYDINQDNDIEFEKHVFYLQIIYNLTSFLFIF